MKGGTLDWAVEKEGQLRVLEMSTEGQGDRRRQGGDKMDPIGEEEEQKHGPGSLSIEDFLDR